MLKKRGQFTVFVILGIVIFIAFALAFCVRNMLRASDMDVRAETILRESLATSPIDYYVTTCIEEVTDEALFLIGAQGGNIYDYQDGTFPFDSSLLGEDFLQSQYEGEYYNVSYGLIPNPRRHCTMPFPPKYPYEKTGLERILITYLLEVFNRTCPDSLTFIHGTFGHNTLQKLCDSEGLNAYNISNMSIFTCDLGTYDSENSNTSVQEQMQDYISLKISECVDFSIFENMTNRNISVIDDPKSTIVFARQGGFSVKVSYPFRVSVDGGEPVTIRQDFQIVSPVRLNEIYRLAHKIISEDARDIFYNKSSDPETTRNEMDTDMSGVRFEFIRRPCFSRCTFGKYDDVLQIIDHDSIVNNKPFVFQFAIRNRNPVLDYINTRQSEKFDIIGSENRSIFFNPIGIDPDENWVNYTYIGWREDYWQWFNYSCCDPLGPVPCTDINELLSHQEQCFPKIVVPVHNWTNSIAYQNTLRQANYTPNFNDTGIHYLTILIEEESGLKDWQNISILIYDLPNATASGYNPYDDISDFHASIEDPYVLNATASVFFSEFLFYEWNDTTEEFYNTTREEVTTLPFDLWPLANIMNMKRYFFNESHFDHFGIPVEHNISLRAASDLDFITWGWRDSFLVDVYQCLPHRNASSLPYPYNTSPNIFMANHTCCNDVNPYYGTYKDTNEMCFQDVLYGQHDLLDFSDLVSKALGSGTSIYPDGEDPTDPGGEIYNNDVFEASFTNYCSGDRGNICSGDYLVNMIVVDFCNDWEPTDTERCQGPKYDVAKDTYFNCIDYPAGHSFEQDFLGEPWADGICNENPRCADKVAGVFTTLPTTSKFSCTAQCDGGTCSKPLESSCYCNSTCGEGDPFCILSVDECISSPDVGFCSDACDFQTPDDTITACNCVEDNGYCDISLDVDEDCWAVNGTGPGFCCQDSDYHCDDDDGACVSGVYFDDGDNDITGRTCICMHGEGAWFGLLDCCDGTVNDIYEDGLNGECCYGGLLLADGDINTGYLLCHSGLLYDCEISYVGVTHHRNDGDTVNGFICTAADGWEVI